MDTGGRVSHSTRGDVGCMGEPGQVEGSMMGRVLVMEEGEEIEVDDIAMVIKGIEDVGMKSGLSEQSMVQSSMVMMVVAGRRELGKKDGGVSLFIII